MQSLCEHCEYGNRFIDLGKCPECETGRIVGDFHTRGIFCSNLHPITTIAVDFCGQRNCWNDTEYTDYEIIITSHLSREQLIAVGKLVEKTPVQIYKSIKEQSAFCEKLYFDNMLKIGKYLYSCKIAFRVVPEVPILYGLPECYPHLVNDYSWVLELHQQKTANKIFPAG